MFLCMRTTLNLDDALMKSVKKEAASSGRTMTEVVDQALRISLAPKAESGEPFRLKMVTVKGRRLPGVDLTDRAALYDLMEKRP